MPRPLSPRRRGSGGTAAPCGRPRGGGRGAPPWCSVQFSSVAQSRPSLCDPMNRSTPGLPVQYQFPEFTQTHVHRVSDAIQPSHPLPSPSPPSLVLVERRDPTGGGAVWPARETRATSCWPRVFLKTRSQDSLARNARTAVCYTGLRLRREGLCRVACVEGASLPGGRRTAHSGEGRGPMDAEAEAGLREGFTPIPAPCPSVLLRTKPIPGFLPKALSAKDLVSLPLLLSCGSPWWLRLSRISLQDRNHGLDSCFRKDFRRPLEEEMETHDCILA